jgi:RNA polymerase sigma factor (sigma-70 family)
VCGTHPRQGLRAFAPDTAQKHVAGDRKQVPANGSQANRRHAEHMVAVDSGEEHRDELRDTLAELQRLPEIDRAALLLRAEEGFTYEEIARILGRSLPTIKVKIHRARLKLIEWRKGVVRASH